MPSAKLPRGFGVRCERLAEEVRSELGKAAVDPLDPRDLANDLAIPVWNIDRFTDDEPDAVTQLVDADPGCFSAATIFCGAARAIVVNQCHAAVRQASSIAHELAHVLLEHEPGPVLEETTSCRTWNNAHEAQADWCGAVLLLPRVALVHRVRSVRDLPAAAEHFGVSADLMRWRFHKSGVAQQLRYRAARRAA
jgi:hypothetical protein